MTGNDLLEVRGTRTIAVYKYKDRISNHNLPIKGNEVIFTRRLLQWAAAKWTWTKNQCEISEPLCPSIWRNKLHRLYLHQHIIICTTIILDPLIRLSLMTQPCWGPRGLCPANRLPPGHRRGAARHWVREIMVKAHWPSHVMVTATNAKPFPLLWLPMVKISLFQKCRIQELTLQRVLTIEGNAWTGKESELCRPWNRQRTGQQTSPPGVAGSYTNLRLLNAP